MIKIWLDDVRPQPVGYDYACKTVEEALFRILYWQSRGIEIFISFDHDLGAEFDAIELAKILEWLGTFGVELPAYEIHSGNPVGRRNIQMALDKSSRK